MTFMLESGAPCVRIVLTFCAAAAYCFDIVPACADVTSTRLMRASCVAAVQRWEPCLRHRRQTGAAVQATKQPCVCTQLTAVAQEGETGPILARRESVLALRGEKGNS